MRDVTEQLTVYFDATVERVAAEDVLAGSDVRGEVKRSTPARVPRLRPAWVVAAGFLATIVVVGSAVGIATLLEGDSAGVDIGSPPLGDNADGLSGPWALLIAVGVIAVLAVVGLVWRNQIGKEQTMQTLERPEVEVSPRPRSPAILILLMALLVLAAGALGWWIGSSGDGSAVGDVPDIVHEFNAAWVGGVAADVAALYAEGGVHYEVRLDEPISVRRAYAARNEAGRNEIVTHVEAGMAYADFERFEVNNVAEADRLIVFEWTAKGMSRPESRSENTPFESTGVTILEMSGDLIAKSTLYYDSAELFN